MKRESLHSFEQSGSWAGLIGLLFETELDGYRAIAMIDPSGKARIWSRNHLPLELKFRTVGEAVNRRGPCSTIFDEEIVASLHLDRRSRIADETIALSNNRGGTFHNMSREGLTYLLPTHAPARLLDLQHPIKADDLCAWDEKIIWRITHIPGQRSK
jgi:hypothetical protein